LNNGATEEEIREVILQATAYCGMPAGIEGFRVASQAIKTYRSEQEKHGHHVDHSTDIGVADRMRTDNI
jgi:4-carboxymuconolactone decarboxylase